MKYNIKLWGLVQVNRRLANCMQSYLHCLNENWNRILHTHTHKKKYEMKRLETSYIVAPNRVIQLPLHDQIEYPLHFVLSLSVVAFHKLWRAALYISNVSACRQSCCKVKTKSKHLQIQMWPPIHVFSL